MKGSHLAVADWAVHLSHSSSGGREIDDNMMKQSIRDESFAIHLF